MLEIKQAELAELCKLSLGTLNNIERGLTDPKVSTLNRIQSALESQGIQFIENGVVYDPK